MVTKLKDNLSYIKYIQKSIKKIFPTWKECGEAVYEGQINDNFGISYFGNISGYSNSIHKVSFVKDRGQLELRIEDKKSNPVALGYLLFNYVLEKIPNQDLRWGPPLSTELIDCYIDFLKLFFEKNR